MIWAYHNAGNDKTQKHIADRQIVADIDKMPVKTETAKLVRTIINKKQKFGL